MPSDESVKAAREWLQNTLGTQEFWNYGTVDKLADLLDRMMAQAKLEGKIAAAQRWGQHEDTYEGTCGVHMSSNCSLCIWLKMADEELERLAGRGK